MTDTIKADKPMKPRARKGSGWLIPPREEGGIWHCQYKYKGHRYRWSSHSPLKSDAIAALDTGIGEIRDGTFRAAWRELTGKDLAEKWLATYVPVSRNAKGVKLATARMRLYFRPFFGTMRARDITKDDLRRYRAHLEALTRDGAEPGTRVALLRDESICHILADARCLLRWAAEGGLIDAAPIPRRLLPVLPEREPRALTLEEQGRVCAVEGPYGFACRVMLGCGARWSEFVRLGAEDLENGELVLRPDADARKTRGGGRIKGRKVRRVPIPAELAREIRGHVGRLTAFEHKDDSQFNRVVRRLSGVAEFSAHRLRHSFATNLLARGANLKVVQTLLGHASITMTERYARVSQDFVREDARRVMGWTARAD